MEFQVIHPMKKQYIKHTSSVHCVRRHLIRALEQIFPIVKNVNSMTVKEFIPKSAIGDGIDNGIYLLRILETYKGMTQRYNLNDLKNTNRYSMKLLHRILFFHENTLKEQVFKSSRPTSSCIPMQDLSTEQPLVDDKFLLNLVMKKGGDVREVFVRTEWMEVSRGGLLSLKRRSCIMDMVIDIFGIYCTYNKPDILFLPTTCRFVDNDKRKYIWSGYVKKDYIPKDATLIKKVFFPLLHEGHWYACVSDLERRITYVLDSCTPNPKCKLGIERTEFSGDQVFNNEKVLEKMKGYESLSGIGFFDLEKVEVPQQTNVYDCGVYVMKYLDAGHDVALWTDKNYYKDLGGYRQRVLLQLLKWDKNLRKDFS